MRFVDWAASLLVASPHLASRGGVDQQPPTPTTDRTTTHTDDMTSTIGTCARRLAVRCTARTRGTRSGIAATQAMRPMRIFSTAVIATASPSTATVARASPATTVTPPVPSAPRGGTAIVLLNMGGPSSVSEVAPFLQRLFTDADIITLGPLQKWIGPIIAKRRTPKIEHQYDAIGGSQIRKWTEIQGRAMVERLDKLSPETAPHKVRRGRP
jgi:hypothetical protein